MRRDVFQAIADPTRRDIICLVGNRTMTLHEIAGHFDTSRQAISKHVKILTECGLVVMTQKGKERYCNVQPEKMNEVQDWLLGFHNLWNHCFGELDELLTNMKTSKNKKI